MEENKLKTLTPTEIETLEVSAALRLIGEYTVLLSQLNKEIGAAIIVLGNAKIKLDSLKNDKSTLVEMMRALKVIAERA